MYLYVQPSAFSTIPAAAPPAGQIYRGVPTPGLVGFGQAAIPQIAGCANLLADSPPTLLEQYDAYSYNIGTTGFISEVSGSALTGVELLIELQFLVNGEPRYSTNSGWQTANPVPATSGLAWYLGWSFVSDLVNDISLTARDRLTLQAGIGCNQALQAGSTLEVVVGAQANWPLTGTGVVASYPSALSYRTEKLPANRRL